MISELDKQNPAYSEQLWQLCERSYSHGSPWSQKQFADDLAQENSKYLIFMKNDAWLGFVSYYQILDEIDISHVVIDKAQQKHGYGKELLSEAIEYWRKNDMLRVLLEVRESNESAIRLYEHSGFQCIHKRKNYYHHPQEDGWILELKL